MTLIQERVIPLNQDKKNEREENKVPNAETLKAMENAVKGQNMSRRFTSVKELMDYLNKDDE